MLAVATEAALIHIFIGVAYCDGQTENYNHFSVHLSSSQHFNTFQLTVSFSARNYTVFVSVSPLPSTTFPAVAGTCFQQKCFNKFTDYSVNIVGDLLLSSHSFASTSANHIHMYG